TATGRRVVQAERGPEFERLGRDRFRLDLRARDQLGRLLAVLADEGTRPAVHVLHPVHDAATELWALASALVEGQPGTAGFAGATVLLPVRHPAPPQHAALAALAATIGAEVPALRCKVVEHDGAADDVTTL
ncbi:hypothetical protein GT039_28105, partial [Streptomyces sp. SID2955]|nr:hypothetical protein [Streptomyces sp. SID2955]